MDRFLFSYNSVIFLTTFLLDVILVIFLLGIKKKQFHTWLLVVYVSLFTLAVFAGLMVLTYISDNLFFAWMMVTIFLTLAPMLLQFSYYFPKNIHLMESRVMLVLSIITLGFSLYLITSLVNFDEMGWFTVSKQVSFSVFALLILQFWCYLWTFTVWVRKILWLEKDSPHPVWRKLIIPKNRHSKAMRSFSVVFSLTLLFPMFDLLQIKSIITHEQQYLLFVSVGILMFALFFLVYITQFPERSSLMTKLLGACLILLLPILFYQGHRSDLLQQQMWHNQRIDEVRKYRDHLVLGTPWLASPQLRYVISYDETPLVGPRHYRLHETSDPSLNSAYFQRWDMIQEERMNLVADLLKGPRPQDGERPLFSAQERVADLHSMSLMDHFIHYDFTHDGRRYELGYSYLDLRRELNPNNLSRARLQIFAILVVFLCFPVLFRRLLVRPLDALLGGVRQANSGNLNAIVPVYAPDEIGFLARSFNSMMSSFRKAQERIEAEVAMRTRLEAEDARKGRELEQARRLQLAMLPQSLPEVPNLEIAVYMKPATEVGGDYYDFRQGMNGDLIVGVGDATGHGLQAGTMVAATKSLFNAMVDRIEPVPFLNETSQALAKMGYENMYMALMIARIQNGNVRLASAGMPFALKFGAQTRELEALRLPGLPLGSSIEFPYGTQEFHLSPGDVLLLRSDGLEERFNPEDAMMGDERVALLFQEHAHLSAQMIVQHLVEAGEKWSQGRPQDDDITLVILKAT